MKTISVLRDKVGRIGSFSAAVSRPNRAADERWRGFTYDALGRLVARWNGEGLVEELAYDGAQMVAAFDASGTSTWSASWAPGMDALLSIANSTGEYLALDDGKANVSGFFRADDSQLAGTAEYTPEGRVAWKDFGTNTGCTEAGLARCAPLLGLPFGFHGAYKSSSTGLVYFRNRWYSAEAGQWLSQDPLGYVDSFNAYAFNRFDPINFVDPWGLEASSHVPTRPCRDEGGVCRIPVEHKPSPAPQTTCDSACQAERKSAAALERTAARASQVQEALANSPEIVMAGAASPLPLPNTTPTPTPTPSGPGGKLIRLPLKGTSPDLPIWAVQVRLGLGWRWVSTFAPRFRAATETSKASGRRPVGLVESSNGGLLEVSPSRRHLQTPVRLRLIPRRQCRLNSHLPRAEAMDLDQMEVSQLQRSTRLSVPQKLERAILVDRLAIPTASFERVDVHGYGNRKQSVRLR